MATVQRTTFVSDDTSKQDNGSSLVLALIILALGGLVFYVWSVNFNRAEEPAPVQQLVEVPNITIQAKAPDASASEATASSQQ